jgi:cytochrome bd-type quinol oxidase subunit 2
MTARRRAGLIAWALAVVWLVLVVAALTLNHMSGSGHDTRELSSTLALVSLAVGILIVSRQPANPIGWIFVVTTVASGVGGLAAAYAEYWIHGKGGSAGLAKAAAVYANSSWVPWVLLPATFLLLLFPDGHLLSRRWRPVAWCTAVSVVGVFLLESTSSGRLEDYPEVVNPYGAAGVAVDVLTPVAVLLLLIGLIGSPLSLILRFRRARPEQRQQIKWIAAAGGLATTVLVVSTAGYDLWGADVANAAIEVSLIMLPVAAGIAILRHRLYDIDVVINRTVVYGALSATLAAVYVGSVLLLQLALSGLTASSNLAIAMSTLAVAALFRPARSRIQATVDRRFYRHRYDAQRTLERFAGRVRDEVGLDALSDELRDVVAETMQPAHISLWLREAQQ